MRSQRLLCVFASLALLTISACATHQATGRRMRTPFPSNDRAFVLPYDAVLYLSPAGGSGSARSEFGICAEGSAGCGMLFEGLPLSPVPAGEIRVGVYEKGDIICFCMKSAWRGNEHWAYSSEKDALSQIAFRDLDGSLDLKAGSIAERISSDMWILHLDDPASFLYDDNDSDVLIRIRLERI
jgi:hypothetical protein